jgi:hypothetical protein
MTWPHNCEVPLIQRCDFGEPQTLCDGYHGGIGDAQREIHVGLHKLGMRRMSSSSISATWKPSL